GAPTKGTLDPALLEWCSETRRPIFGQGQPDGKLGAAAGAIAGGLDAAAVQLDQAFDEGEPEPESTAAAELALLRLDERVEELGQDLRRDADAGIADGEDGRGRWGLGVGRWVRRSSRTPNAQPPAPNAHSN